MKYQNKYKELKKTIDSKVETYQYGKGGEIFHRGVLCPSKIIDVIAGNAKRGRLLKSYKETVDFIYSFDKDNCLGKVEMNEENPYIEYIVYEGDLELGFTYNSDRELLTVSKCRKERGRIVEYFRGYSILEVGVCGCTDGEKYDYSQKGQVLVEREDITDEMYCYSQIEVFLDQEGYSTTYTAAGIIGEQVWDQVFEGKFDRKVKFFIQLRKRPLQR